MKRIMAAAAIGTFAIGCSLYGADEEESDYAAGGSYGYDYRYRASLGEGLESEAYAWIDESAFHAAADAPLSTFSIDVDTASYSNVRRFLNGNALPPQDAVRIEELVNYFSYAYPRPEQSGPPAVDVEVTGCPWQPEHRLVRIGLAAQELRLAEVPPVNLVFLLDVSGSMETLEKLPLVQRSMELLVERLREDDRVAIVVYAGAAGLVLPPTSGDRKPDILRAIETLEAGGSTAGGEGIELAYSVAAQMARQGAVSRVILATDGDFNVGIASEGELTRFIEEKARTGVFLTVLGFGTGNLKDATLESLADRGNGSYAYVDTLTEARKVMTEQIAGTLVTVAKDVKIQVEWNPARVARYRLVGYENRTLAAEDFRDDTKDAGELGAGHTVTALYEVVPAGANALGRAVDALRYQSSRAPTKAALQDEILTVKVRWQPPSGGPSFAIERRVADPGHAFADASADTRFAAAVASFGMLLRGSPHRGVASYESVLAIAADATANDAHRREFVTLVEKARDLKN
jgi:Ca-activated chloride channel homolog